MISDEAPIDSTPLSRRLLAALVTPIALVVSAGSLLAVQVTRMSNDAHWLDRSDEVIARSYELQKEVVDQETGFRGFLVTGDPAFLEPFHKANPREVLRDIKTLVGDNPEQLERVNEISRRYERWLAETQPVIDTGQVGVVRSREELLVRKKLMDDFRATASDMMTVERGLRRQRAEAAETSVRATRIAFAGLIVILAAVLAISSRRQIGAIAKTFTSALKREEGARFRLMGEDWVRRGQVQLAQELNGERAVSDVAERALRFLANYVGADIGAFYTLDGPGWTRLAGFALDSEAAGPGRFKLGEGLVGQTAVAKQMRHLSALPADYLKVRSGTGQRQPVDLVILPGCTDDYALAVLEFGFLREASPQSLALLERVGEAIAVAVRSAQFRARLQDLLEESQRQAEKLQMQQEELQVANEELETQSDALRRAHAQLEERKEELEVTNASLLQQRNDLERAQDRLEEKAGEIERASRYKSEFLANMSHELRTPLNSSLILAKLLANNKEGNLSPEQVKFATMIHDAGNDLLALINDILDLSKVEAGKVEVRASQVLVAGAVREAARTAEPLAREKKILFDTRIDESAPEKTETDGQRLQQILKNLLSNAVKFTEAGRVSLVVRGADENVEFAVTDTGIGIAPDQREAIFEPFRQANGTANRRFGGTGLGLSISRNLARLLGGDVRLESRPGEGSTFTLVLPRTYVAPEAPVPPPEVRPRARRKNYEPATADDRDVSDPKRRTVLVIEDDETFAKILLDLAHELDFRCLVAHSANEGIDLALEQVPSAILLDIHLPDHSGLSVLDRLKRDPKTRHVPVHIISVEDHSREALSMGAAGYIRKPVQREDLLGAFRKLEDQLSRRVRKVLIVEDDDRQREAIVRLLGADDVATVGVGTTSDALVELRSSTFDCVVTDLAFPDGSGGDLIEKMASDDSYSFPPVIVYTGRSLNADEEQRLRKYSSSIIVKGARSPERLLDEVTLFLHRVESELPPEQRKMLRQSLDREAIFEGRRILVVEDDVRNVFALSSVLEPKGLKLSVARNGREALEMLEKTPDVQLVLMDIMMPEMDGLEAMREIRKVPRWTKLPIVALTAKAMRDDRERAVQAGANDYISKPLDFEMLLSLLRVWMPRG